MHEEPKLRCKSCKREVHPWVLGHASCSPKDWVYCITTTESRWELTEGESQ